MSLPLRTFGRTDLVVSRLGLGLAALGRPAYMVLGHDSDIGDDKSPGALEARSSAVLGRAWELGVRYVDVARSYGRAEDFVAAWAEAKGRDVVVGSKWGYAYTADWRIDAAVHEQKEHSRARFEAQLEESRARLGARLRIYHVHSATEESGVFSNPSLLDALARLRDDGVLVGLSTTGADQATTLRRALAIRRGGAPLFRSVQSTWNLLETSVGDALREAHADGMGVIVKEGLANGRLAGRGDDRAARELSDEAARLGTTPDALALAAIFELPFVDVVLSGASTVAQLESNARAATLSLAALDRDRLARLVEDPAQYWSARKTLPWT